MDGTMSLLEIIKTIKRHWRLILLVTLSSVLISTLVSFYLLTPIYKASTQILVNQKNSGSSLDTTLLRSNIDLINTYSVIMKSSAILEKVINELDLTQSVDELNEKIIITSEEGSQVFSLTVQDEERENAVKIANAITETFQKEIPVIMNVDNVSILVKAQEKKDSKPVSPKPLLNIIIAGILGLMVGVGISFLIEFLDNSLKDEQDVTLYLGIPVLGTIQEMSDENIKGFTKQNIGSETVVSYSKE